MGEMRREKKRKRGREGVVTGFNGRKMVEIKKRRREER